MLWQQAHPGAPFVTSGPGLGLNDPLMEWPDRTPADVLDHHALGYVYDVEPQPTGKPATGNDMVGDEVLTPGAAITSANGRYSFIYQGDGNLVLYAPWGPMWASNTAGNPGARLIIQDDGNVVSYRTDNHPIWDTGTWERCADSAPALPACDLGGLLWRGHAPDGRGAIPRCGSSCRPRAGSPTRSRVLACQPSLTGCLRKTTPSIVSSWAGSSGK